MRIIGGTLRSRRFSPPAKNWHTRPTTDVAREALYNILEHKLDWEKTSMLDLFAGTGSHSYEALSRGCAQVTCVEKYPVATRYIAQTARELDIAEKLTIHCADVFRYLRQQNTQYDYIFADPPFALPNIQALPTEIFSNNLLVNNGLLAIEHGVNTQFETHPNFSETRRYGSVNFTFFIRNI